MYGNYQGQQQGQCVSERTLWPWRLAVGWTSWCRRVQQWPCWASAVFPPGTHGDQTGPCRRLLAPKHKLDRFATTTTSKSQWLLNRSIETNLFCDVLAALQVVVSIRKDLWLHDRHQSILLRGRHAWVKTLCSSWSRWDCSGDFTCWQMLAYLASTLAFSAMARAEGQLSEILSTHLHLAKSQPSFLYWAQRSDSPSRPVEERLGLPGSSSLPETLPINRKNAPCVVVSPSVPFKTAVPLSTWRPTRPLLRSRATSGKNKTRLRSQAPHLDADGNALFLDDLGEELATVRLLVERLVEEDDAAHAGGHGGIGGEEDVTEGATVFLGVLHVDLLQTFPHGSCTDRGIISAGLASHHRS